MEKIKSERTECKITEEEEEEEEEEKRNLKLH